MGSGGSSELPATCRILERRKLMIGVSEDLHRENFRNEVISPSGPFRLLSLANEFEKAGVTSYAIDLYTKILDKYPDTFEAVASRLALFLIASRYESEGKKEPAISLIRKISKGKSHS